MSFKGFFPLRLQKNAVNLIFYDEIKKLVKENDASLHEGDVLVISSKYISNSQGRILDHDSIKSSEMANELSRKFSINQKLSEAIIRESDIIFGGVSGFVITSSDNIMAPNAGIDKSNSQGKLILYPDEPYLVAEQIKRKFFLDYGIHIGVIIVDSRLMPARVGTTGVAIACSGIEPVLDRRATKDLDGNALKVTFQATADNLASIANHKMGEADELLPIAIVRESGAKLTNRKISSDETAIPYDQCVYVRGLKKS
ncbi:MAG: coenzyme F420-0:L-glutamate ligase [Nitrososphaerota archaeon]|nr:MAG: coenzyme F420-0:L-glutamate ligase [Nitrososphaerota archaeon]